ncbi:MAG: hypothetical protein ACQEWF_17940 [Bacillota bacterium]
MRGERVSGSIRLQDVAFAYPGKEENVIKGVSLSIGAGENQTIIIVSHLLSTVLSAEKIVVLEDGRIVEEGKHADLLLNQTGMYSRLFGREAEIGGKTIDHVS